MAQVILIKRGQATNINSANLREGELALGFNQDKSAVVLYVGNGTNTPIEVNGAAITAAITAATTAANNYTDTAISNLVDGAPQTMDTLKEVADALAANDDVVTALNAAIGSKITNPAGGTTGQVLKKTDNGVEWADDEDTTYGTATTTDAGLMSATDKAVVDGIPTALDGKVDKVTGKGLSTEDYTSTEKTKLAGIDEGANNYSHPASHAATMITEDATHRFATDAEKTAWNAKLGADSVIDGGTF